MNESTIRLSAFLGGLLVMTAWEVLAPRRPRVATRPRRWLTNFGMILLGTIPLQWIFPILAMGMAVTQQQSGEQRKQLLDALLDAVMDSAEQTTH